MTSLHAANTLADAGDWGHMGGWGWGMAAFGLLMVVALVALLAWLALAVRPGSGTEPPRTAVDLLAARYARGEIDRDEYLERKSDLEA